MSMTEDGFDLQAFARRTQAVREFVHHREKDGVKFEVRYPSRFERLAYGIEIRKIGISGITRRIEIAFFIIWLIIG